ncbi:MAG: hypothetical protein L0I24_00090 [Pseudonocardia sp.]|nr:hypothetical protein [Pseudonocardia sp.]
MTKPDVSRAGAPGVVGVRLHTRAPITLPWLSAAVIPAVRELSLRGSAKVRVRRGWLGGPHVDILARDVIGPPTDWPDLAERLDAGPLDASTALSGEAYLAQAREFGRWEQVPPPYLPMREHGEIALLDENDARKRGHGLDHLSEAAVVDSVLCRPVVDLIDELAVQPGRATVRLAEAFAALGDSYFLGLAYGAFSFRSHAEAFLGWVAPTRDVRPLFAARLERESAELRAVVEQRLSGDVGPAAASWRVAFAYCTGALDSAVGRGDLTVEMLHAMTAALDRSGTGPPGAPDAMPAGDSPDTPFHRAVDESGVIAHPTPWFASYRMLINLFYEQLPLLTVSPMQRYYTCYAIAELVDDVLGESWQERLENGRLRMAGTR